MSYLPLILASTSTYRRQVLRAAGVAHQAVSPDYHELPLAAYSPEELVAHHAQEKAQVVTRRYAHAIVVGCDQGVIFDGQLLGKPGSARRAVEQLMELSGQTHMLVTAVAAIHGPSGKMVFGATHHTMRMRSLTPEQAIRYVERDNPVDCAGSYKVESGGAALFLSMEGTDHTGIVGLPLSLLGALIDELDGSWTHRLWKD